MKQAVYVIGDVQGCYEPMMELVEKIELEDPDARLLFVGDLVNRGPNSLDVLQKIRSWQIEGRAESVLGNHDLHLLALAHHVRNPHKHDTLQAILNSPERDLLLNWLRQRPLAMLEQHHLIVHAGIYPQWSQEQALACAHELQQVLRSDLYHTFLAHMYGNTPTTWSESLTGMDRLRAIVNGFTRMRFCNADGELDFDTKDNAEKGAPGHAPWFQWPRVSAATPVIFGHWSTLGLLLRDDICAIDTGCVWGGKLTALGIHNRRVIQVQGKQEQVPGQSST